MMQITGVKFRSGYLMWSRTRKDKKYEVLLKAPWILEAVGQVVVQVSTKKWVLYDDRFLSYKFQLKNRCCLMMGFN